MIPADEFNSRTPTASITIPPALAVICRASTPVPEDNKIREKLHVLPESEVSFNYLGQFDQVLSDSELGLARESSGPARSLKGNRGYLLEINGSIRAGQLRLTWSYSDKIHQHATIENLAKSFMQSLRSLITHCQSAEAGGYTPSDFPDVELSQEGLDKILAEINFGSKQDS